MPLALFSHEKISAICTVSEPFWFVVQEAAVVSWNRGVAPQCWVLCNVRAAQAAPRWSTLRGNPSAHQLAVLAQVLSLCVQFYSPVQIKKNNIYRHRLGTTKP